MEAEGGPMSDLDTAVEEIRRIFEEEPAPKKRKSTGKRLRFSVFARDNFTCRYCGRQSDKVELVIDHLIPVSKGGTNDQENLITACVECNQGKADRIIEQSAPTEEDRLRMAQELNEQRHAAARAAEIAKAIQSRRQEMVNLWCGLTGNGCMDRRTAATVFSYIQRHGEESVYPWIESAFAACSSGCRPGSIDVNMGRYVSGIRRTILQQEGTDER
jgi:hypothetical protein